MNPQILALLITFEWGIGGTFKKEGLQQLDISIRKAVAPLITGAVSFPQWKSLRQAGTKAILMRVVGGGIVAGSIGMLCTCAAINGTPLSKVMPIAFTSPLFGLLMGIIFSAEAMTWKTAIGSLLTIAGIVMLTI